MTVGQRLRAVAAATGSAPAVVTAEQVLTYRELVDRVGRLARLLADRGAGPGDRVGLLLERSADFVVGWLGGIWAGAVAVPLDPADPPARTGQLARLCGVRLLLTDGRPPPPWADPADIVQLDAERFRLAAGPAGEPHDPGPAAPAAVCCTSGSTGLPKAVLVPHEAVLAGADWAAAAFGAGPGDGHVLKTSVGFTSVLRQVAWPLLTGGWTYVLPGRDTRDLAALARVLRSREVTICSFFPSTVNAALEAGLDLVGSLRHLMFGGEPLPGEVVRRTRAATGAALHNVYGMTECNVALWYPCPPTARFDTAPLGGPVAGLTARLSGVDGELVVAGPHVALGYAGDPARTAARFSTVDGQRAFATRDLVSRAPGGLRFGGRSDDRVKVRGYSVQLGGIESGLAAHPAVVECAVLVRDRGVSDQRLEAAAVLRRPVPVAELQEHLRRELPDYMVPGVVRVLDALPRLSNGKLDRQRLLALPEPAGPPSRPPAGRPPFPAGPAAGSGGGSTTGRPAGPVGGWVTEARALLAGVLDVPVDRVGPDDDFAALGGHSLLLLRLGTEIERRHGVPVELDELLERPTAARLGALLADRAAGAPGRTSGEDAV